MNSYKELWIEQYSAALDDFEAQGIPNAEDRAIEYAEHTARERYANMIDQAKLRHKEAH